MANTTRGEVEFKDSDGKSYVLKLGANQMATHQDELDKLSGVKSLRRLLQIALTWKDDQKSMTAEQVGDLIDDLGIDRMNELIEQTRWGAMAKEAGEKAKAKDAKTAEGNGNPPTPGASS